MLTYFMKIYCYTIFVSLFINVNIIEIRTVLNRNWGVHSSFNCSLSIIHHTSFIMSLEITEEQVRRFQEDGALKIENIFTPEWVETVKRGIEVSHDFTIDLHAANQLDIFSEESGFTESIFREAGCEGRSGESSRSQNCKLLVVDEQRQVSTHACRDTILMTIATGEPSQSSKTLPSTLPQRSWQPR